MKVILAGSRSINDYSMLLKAIEESNYIITTVISGGAKGVDILGEQYAQEHGLPVEQYIPKWKELGRTAGFIRNAEMAANADACIVLWDGNSSGSKSMIIEATKRNIPVYVKTL